MNKVTAIIVSYDGSSWIEKCIGSLQQSTTPIDIIAIDNGSTDGTPDIIRSKFPTVQIIENKVNLGFGKANNIGIRKAYDSGADYVFLLNQDAWVENDTIEKLLKIAQHHPEYGIYSPFHLDGTGTTVDYGFLNYLCRDKSRHYISELLVKKNDVLNEIYELDFINAAFWLLPRNTIEIVGGFNPFFFHYGEDREYVNRCIYWGLKIGFVPDALAYHDRLQFDSETKKSLLAKNSILIDLFDPSSFSNVNALIKQLRKQILKDLLKFNFKDFRSMKIELDYYSINQYVINDICNKVKKKGLNFL
jgi:N-acetylglucosaminyl-diphospho-decaprenol L-rhamnosyltransferase